MASGAERKDLRQGRAAAGGIAAALFAVVLALSPGSAAGDGRRGAEGLCRFDEAPPAMVTAIVGDAAFRLADGRIVVLAAVDVPRQRLGPTEGVPALDLSPAAAFLSGAILGRSAGIAPVSTDRYGRIRAQVRLPDGAWLQAGMVAAGLARVHPLAGEAGCAGVLLDAEAQARTAGRGLWADPDTAARSADDPSLLARSGLYEVIEGRVVSVARGLRLVFIDFGRNFRHDFTVMVPMVVADGMALSGTPAEGLRGRRVRVRGVIEESGGPAIRLADPVELEVVDEGGAGGVGE